MNQVEKPSLKPFQVWVVGSDTGIHSGYLDEGTAAKASAACNERAKQLGIKARYEVRAAA